MASLAAQHLRKPTKPMWIFKVTLLTHPLPYFFQTTYIEFYIILNSYVPNETLLSLIQFSELNQKH